MSMENMGLTGEDYAVRRGGARAGGEQCLAVRGGDGGHIGKSDSGTDGLIIGT